MWGRAFAFGSIAASLLACADPAPTSPATLAGDVLLASRAELSTVPLEPTAPTTAVVKAEPER